MKQIVRMCQIFVMMIFLQLVPVVRADEQPKSPQASADAPKIAQLENTVEELIVQKKEYSAALQEYATAAKANPQMPYYRDQYAMLRRVIKLKQLLDEETNLEKWKSYAAAVRAYYYSKGYYSESLELDRSAAKKFETAEFAANVLETLLIMDQNAEASQFLQSLSISDKTARFQTLEAVLLARNGKASGALKAIQTIQITPKTDPMPFFDFARVYWALEDKENAYSNLTSLMEHTVPSEQPIAQIMIQKSSEFAPLQETKELMAVLATKSKVSQSSCTGGSSCASCSVKDKCASAAK